MPIIPLKAVRCYMSVVLCPLTWLFYCSIINDNNEQSEAYCAEKIFMEVAEGAIQHRISKAITCASLSFRETFFRFT